MKTKSKILPWAGAIIVVVAGGYYFLKVRPKQQTQQLAEMQQPNMGAPVSVMNRAVENIGSKRVRSLASRRLPKMRKARSV